MTDHPKGALTLDQGFNPKTYDELYPGLSRKELAKRIGDEIETLQHMMCLTGAELARSYEVSASALKQWLAGAKLPERLQQRKIRRVNHSFAMKTAKHLLLLPPTDTRWLNTSTYTIISAFDEMHFEFAIERAEDFRNDAERIFSDIPELNEYLARNSYLLSVALRYHAAEEGLQTPERCITLLEEALSFKPKTKGIIYATNIELLQYRFKAAEFYANPKIRHAQLSDIWRELNDLYHSLPEYAVALWNLARVSSALEDEQKCKYVWGEILNHDLAMMYRPKTTVRSKKLRILYTPDMDYFIRVNNINLATTNQP